MANQWKEFSAEDMSWIINNLPLMEVREKRTLLYGKLCFTDVTYPIDNQNITLSGCYEIEMRMLRNGIPDVSETGGYLSSLAKEKNRCLRGMHVFPQKEEGKIPLCLGLDWRTIRNSVESIIDSLIIPYFWFYTYYEKYGKDPWACLKHDVGFLQDYAHNPDMDVLSYMIEKMPADEIFREIIEHDEIPENGHCLCSNKKISCDCRGMEGFRLLQEEFHRICQEIQGPPSRKIGNNERCPCGDMKAKKCTCGEMENLRKQRENYPNYKSRIKVCHSKAKKANQQGESKEVFVKHMPSQNTGGG